MISRGMEIQLRDHGRGPSDAKGRVNHHQIGDDSILQFYPLNQASENFVSECR